jgi:hypothetical protein
LSVFGVLKVVGDQQREAVVGKDVSIKHGPRAHGRRSHRTFTKRRRNTSPSLPYPALTGLSGWTSIAASRGPAMERVPVFELAASTQETPMDLTALRKAVGAADTVPDADVISQAAPSWAKSPRSPRPSKRPSRSATPPAPNSPAAPRNPRASSPPTIATGSVNNLHRQVELMAREGTISGEQATAVKGLIGTPDKPNVLALSRTGADHPAEKWLEVLALGKGGVKSDGKSQTDVQELSRQRHDHSGVTDPKDDKPDLAQISAEAMAKEVARKYAPTAIKMGVKPEAKAGAAA